MKCLGYAAGKTVSYAYRGTYVDFLNALAIRESSNNFRVESATYHYLGRYQLGELALADIGWYYEGVPGQRKAPNDYKGTWTSLAKGYGVKSKDDFLNKPHAQEAAVRAYHKNNWKYLSNRGALKYLGGVVNDRRWGTIFLSESALLAGSHLCGAPAISDYLKSNRRMPPSDGLGTQVTEYMSMFGGYNISAIMN